MQGSGVQRTLNVQRVQRMQGRDAGFMNAGLRGEDSTEGAESAGCRGAGLMSAGGQRVQGSGVQGVRECRAQGCRGCRGSRVQRV